MVLIYLHLQAFKIKYRIQFNTIQDQSRTGVDEYELRHIEKGGDKQDDTGQ